MLANIGWTEILIIGGLILIFFGGTRLPKIIRGLGKSGRELKKAKKESSEASPGEDDKD